MKLKITICPTCGSSNLNQVCRDWTSTVKGKTYTVPALEFYECPDCGEKIFDSEAMQKIESYSPSYAKKKLKKAA